MIDRYLLPLQAAALRPAADALAAMRISANAVTLAGFALGLLAALSIASQSYHVGLALLLANRVFDGLDGALARKVGATDRGAFLDIALDFFFYASIPLAFALSDPPKNALAASALLAAFMGTSSSFLAFAAIAAQRGQKAEAFPQKGIYYLGGLTEGAETILAFTAMCLFPGQFPIIAWVFAFFAVLTTLLRWMWGWRLFSGRSVQCIEQRPHPRAVAARHEQADDRA